MKTSMIVLILSLVGCTAYTKVTNPYDPGLKSAQSVIIRCKDQNTYNLRSVRVLSGAISGSGVRYNGHTHQSEEFDGSIFMDEISEVGVVRTDVQLTLNAMIAILFHALVTVYLWKLWSSPKKSRKSPTTNRRG